LRSGGLSAQLLNLVRPEKNVNLLHQLKRYTSLKEVMASEDLKVA
jgi:hypothetical protein